MAIVKKISELTPKDSNLANTDLLIVGVDNGTDYDLKSVTGAQLLGNVANGLVPYTGATTNVNLGEFEVKAGQVSLDTTPTGTATVTTTRWNDSLGISETTLKGGSVVLKNGVDLVARVVNKVTPTTTLTKANYQVVRISGAQGQRLAVNLAQANNDNNSADTLGVVCETIVTNAEGFIMTMGQLENINTTGSLQSETWVDGDVLYLSPTTAGKITNIKPTGATGHIVILGYVEYAHAVNGKIYVKIMNGWELDELHNVSISGPLDKQVLSYENSTSLWKNKSVTTADIADSTNKRYVTDANLTVIANTSGTNTGDQDLSGYQPLLSGGITNRLTKWSSSSVISNSLIQDNGTTLSIGTTPVANNLFKVSSNGTEATISTENSQASGVGILGSSSGSNGIGASFTATSSTGIKVGVNGSATGSGGTNKGGVFGATGGVNNYSIQLTDGTQGLGKFLKSVTANGEANWVNIANTDVSGLGTLATQNGTFSGTSSGSNTGDQTFLDARVQSVTSSATVTPLSTNDLVIITAQAVGLTLSNPTGTFTEGQALMVRIKDNGTARTIAFDTNYRAIGVTLPTTTVISKTLYLGIIYNSTDTKWDIIGYNIQA